MFTDVELLVPEQVLCLRLPPPQAGSGLALKEGVGTTVHAGAYNSTSALGATFEEFEA